MSDRIKKLGLQQALDGRSVLAIALKTTREAIYSDLGGEANLTEAKKILIERCCRNLCLLEVLDRHLFQMLEKTGKLWYGRGRATTPDPLLKTRAELERSLESTLSKLGLERKELVVSDLKSYINESYESNSNPPSSKPIEQPPAAPSTPTTTTPSEAASTADMGLGK